MFANDRFGVWEVDYDYLQSRFESKKIMETPAEMAHGVIAMLFVAAMLGHIYIGTIGMEGAFEAMGEGTVDINWAKEHHNLWLEEVSAHSQSHLRQQQPAATPGE